MILRNVHQMQFALVEAKLTFGNVLKLLKAKHYVEAAFLMPFACWFGVIYSSDIDLSLRLFLAQSAVESEDMHVALTDRHSKQHRNNNNS